MTIAVPAGTGDASWLRAFHAVVPGVVRAFGPDVLVTQHGTDSHREDPLADLNLSRSGPARSLRMSSAEPGTQAQAPSTISPAH